MYKKIALSLILAFLTALISMLLLRLELILIANIAAISIFSIYPIARGALFSDNSFIKVEINHFVFVVTFLIVILIFLEPVSNVEIDWEAINFVHFLLVIAFVPLFMSLLEVSYKKVFLKKKP